MSMNDNPEKEQREKILAETAKMAWSDLQRWFASGSAVYVEKGMDLIEVAWQMSQDNKAVIEPWITDGRVGRVSDEQARSWLEANAMLWTVVVKPWVLVQPVTEFE